MIKEELFGIDPRRDELFSKIVAVYAAKSAALVYGRKEYTSDDRRLAPYIENGVFMIPTAFFLRSIGEAGAIDGEYESLAVLCARYGLYLHTEINGLAIYSREDVSDLLDWNKNMRLMRNIAEAFVFEDVSGEQMLQIIQERFPHRAHPRLIFTEEKLKTIKREVFTDGGDRVYKRIYADLKKYADSIMNLPPFDYAIIDGIRLLYICRKNAEQMLTCAATYLVSGEEKYAERAYLTMRHCAEFKDFNPYHFLDVGEMAVALGLCYDWLYGWMGEERREPIRRAIVEKAIYQINLDFDDLPRRRSWNWRGELADNWRLVISGVAVGAMAIIDELAGEDLEKAKRAIEQPIYDIRRALSLFAPYGAYEEGHTYWYYGMKHYAYLMCSLLSCAGTDFGYIDVPGMRLTDGYMFAMNGPVSTFDYHDCDLTGHRGNNIPPETMLFASYFGDYGAAVPRIHRIMTEEEPDPCRRLADLFLYDTRFSDTEGVKLPLDTCLPIAEVASMRTGFDRDAMWLGFHCDDPISGEGHDHMDSGSFVLDALGEGFFLDLGKDDYTLPNYLHCYRVRDEGHNVVIFNPDGDYSMRWGGNARIVEHGSTPEVGYAVGDLSRAYRECHAVRRYLRGAGLYRPGRVAVIRDEIELDTPAEIYWFAHTRAEITLLDGGKTAVLTRGEKRLFATITEGEGAEFSVLPAVPLPSSPRIVGQDENEGVRKLTVHIKSASSLRLTVAFSEEPHPTDNPLLNPIHTWKNIE